MNVLVTGLCLSRNLGGPAMGLTLMHELEKRFGKINFTFSISPSDYQQELQWATYYDVDIVRKELIIHSIPQYNMIRKLYRAYKRITSNASVNYVEIHKEHMQAFQKADIVIDMSGISYVGDGSRPFLEAIGSFSNFYYSRKNNTPFFRFIQSFGPFSSFLFKYYARQEFKALPFIPTRGKVSASYCKKIISDPEKVYDFPDVAILLPKANAEWSNEYLRKKKLRAKQFVVLSPSAAIYKLPESFGGCTSEQYVQSFAKIAESILKDEEVLFMPHMYSNNPRDCDREVCKKVISLITDKSLVSHIHLVEDDLDPMQAKALISTAKSAIVSRYHALVAALSTSTPVITIGWHAKYRDLMEYYELEEQVVDIKDQSDQVERQVLSLYTALPLIPTESMTVCHQRNIEQVNTAFDMLESAMRDTFEKEVIC